MHNPLHPHDACRPAAPRRPAPGGGGDRLRPRPAQGLIRARPRPRRAAPDRSAARARRASAPAGGRPNTTRTTRRRTSWRPAAARRSTRTSTRCRCWPGARACWTRWPARPRGGCCARSSTTSCPSSCSRGWPGRSSRPRTLSAWARCAAAAPPPSPPGQAAATAPCCSPALARSARREALPCRAPACLPIHIALQDIRSCLSQTHWMRRSGCRGGIPLGSAQGALGLTRDRRPGTGGGRVGGAGAAGAALRLDGRPRVCVPGARAGHRLPAARAGVRALPSPRAHRRTCTQAAPVWQAACQDTGLDDAGEGRAQRMLCVLLRPSGADLAGWS